MIGYLQEKDDNLRLALAVGELLSQNGVDVLYTRTDDVYDSPYRKAMIANESGADYLISFHRNASPIAGNASGIETLVYADRGVAAQMARDINRELAALGFRDIGVIERPGLAVLRRSRMPAVLIETGVVAVNKASLEIPKGIYGLLGENGAGKTTLMRVLTTVLKQTEGMVSLDGILYNERNYAKIQKKIGYLPQEIDLYPNLTVREVFSR